MTKENWRKRIGLKAKDIKVYIPQERYERWKEDAESKGAPLSSYLQQLAIEGEKGSDLYKKIEKKDFKIQELILKISDLEKQSLEDRSSFEKELQQEKQKHGIFVNVEEFIDNQLPTLLSNSPQSIGAIVQKAVSGGWASDLITKPIEDALYRLSKEGKVQYSMGKGWRLENE